MSADSYPFGAADHQWIPQDLARDGYVEEEFLASGTANVYSWPAPGPAVVRTPSRAVHDQGAGPAAGRARDFSGNVVVEMLNPSNLFDLNIGWAMMNRELMHNGDVWVGITGKPVSIVALQNFDIARYGTLSMANPLPLDDPAQLRRPAHADRGRQLADDRERSGVGHLHAGRRLAPQRRPDQSRAYGGQRSAEHVYGFGYSQTGGYLYNYINGIQPLVVQADGRPMYDGYIVAVAGGAFVGALEMNQCEPRPAVSDPRQRFVNVGVPVIHVMSQSDYLFGIAGRQHDSDAPPQLYRHYEMSGTGHATPDELYYSASQDDIGRPAGRCRPSAATRDPAAASPAASSSTPCWRTSMPGCGRGSRRRAWA